MTYAQTSEEVTGSLPPGYAAVKESSLQQYAASMKSYNQLKKKYIQLEKRMDSVKRVPVIYRDNFDSINLVNKVNLSDKRYREIMATNADYKKSNEALTKALWYCREQVTKEKIRENIRRIGKIGADGKYSPLEKKRNRNKTNSLK